MCSIYKSILIVCLFGVFGSLNADIPSEATIIGSTGTKTFYIHPATNTFEIANYICHDGKGSDLATVENDYERSVISQYFTQFDGPSAEYWISGTNFGTLVESWLAAKDWYWVTTQTKINSTMWLPSFPQPVGGSCMTLQYYQYNTAYNIFWFNRECTALYSMICQQLN